MFINVSSDERSDRLTCVLFGIKPKNPLKPSAGNGWPHNALRHHWLMPISCHFQDYKALLVTSLAHVSGAIASVQTFTFYLYLGQAMILDHSMPFWPEVWSTKDTSKLLGPLDNVCGHTQCVTNENKNQEVKKHGHITSAVAWLLSSAYSIYGHDGSHTPCSLI